MKEPKYKFIDIHKIEANGHQPRTHFENEKIQELAVSIQQNGLLQPIVVRPYQGKYQIVVGERRYRACLLAGIEEVPCLVQNYDEQQTATAAIVENIQRENLSAIEEALAYQQILDTQNNMLREIMDKGLNVEQTEEKIKKKIEPKKPKPKTKSISQNLKIAMNTLDQAAMMVQQAGVDISVDISETEDEVIYVIKMKK